MYLNYLKDTEKGKQNCLLVKFQKTETDDWPWLYLK